MEISREFSREWRVKYDCAHDPACTTTNAYNRKHARHFGAPSMILHTIQHAQQPTHATTHMQGAFVRHIGMCTIPSMHGNVTFRPMALHGPNMDVSWTKTNRHPQPKSSRLIYIYIYMMGPTWGPSWAQIGPCEPMSP